MGTLCFILSLCNLAISLHIVNVVSLLSIFPLDTFLLGFFCDTFLTKTLGKKKGSPCVLGLSKDLVSTSTALHVNKLKLCGKDTEPCGLS